MAANNWGNIEVHFETRLCTVGEDMGYFHCWEHYSRPLEASPLAGGAPAGVFSKVYGLVEFPDGVKRIESYRIQFCDEQHAILCEMARQYKERIQGGETDA